MSEPREPAMWDDESAEAGNPVEEAGEPAAEQQTSGSEVTDASVILVLQVRDAHFSPWAETPGVQPRVRTGKLQLAITGVFKGHVDQPLNQPFEMEISQRGGDRMADYYGPWAHVAVRPSGVLLAFSKGGVTDARLLLSDRYCQVLVEATPQLIGDTREAVGLEARHLPPQDLLAAASHAPQDFGDLFARFVCTQVRGTALRSVPLFEAWLRLVENPRTRPPARDVYLSSIYDGLEDMAPPPGQQEILLAQSMFRLLLMPETADLKENIAGVLLPNLLRLEAKSPKYTATQILQPEHFDRARLAGAVTAVADDQENVKKLLNWLAK